MITLQELPTIIIILLFFLSIAIYIFCFWIKSKNDLSSDNIFDIAIVTLIFGVICLRIFGILDNLSTYFARGWSLLPMSQIEDQTRFFYTLPWSILDIRDGNVKFIGFLFGVIIGFFIIYVNSSKQKTILKLIDNILVSFLLAGPVILIIIAFQGIDLGNIQNGFLKIFYKDDTQGYFPIQIFQILLLILFLLISIISKKKFKAGVFSGIFLISYGISEFILRFYSRDYYKDIFNLFNLYQLLAIIILVIGIWLLLFLYNNKLKSVNKIDSESTNIDSNLQRKRTFVRKNFFPTKLNKYNVSYADRKQNISEDLTTREHLTRQINKFRRKLSK